MTILTLTKTAMAPISDLSDVLLLPQSSEMVTHAAPSLVRVYAGGVRRIVSTPGEAEVVTVTFSRMDRADYTSMLNLLRVAILFRDQRGRQLYGVFSSISGEEVRTHPDRVMNVAIVVENITYSEIV